MKRWLVLISILVAAVAYRAYLAHHRQIPQEIQQANQVLVLDEVGKLGNNMLMTSAAFGLNLADFGLAKLFVNVVYGYLLNGFQDTKFPEAEVKDMAISNIPVRVFTPKHVKQVQYPAMVYIHGGGWTWLSVDVYSRFLAHLSNVTNLMIIAPRYRQAPAHVFPAGLDDCRQVTWNVLAGKSQLPINTDYVIIAGDESGGNMAAVIAQEFPQKLYMQILFNPVLQMFDFLTPSYQDNFDSLPGITSPSKIAVQWLTYTGYNIKHFTDLVLNAHRFPDPKFLRYQRFLDSKTHLPSYLKLTNKTSITPSAYNSDLSRKLMTTITNQSLCPMLNNNVKGVPNAYIVTSQFDVLRDEAIMYINRLQTDGAKVKLKHYKAAFHGFVPFAGSQGPFKFDVSEQAVRELVEFISYQVHRPIKSSRAV